MGHVKAGAQRFVAAGNGDEHGVVAEPLKDARAHDVGIARLHVRVELAARGLRESEGEPHARISQPLSGGQNGMTKKITDFFALESLSNSL